MRTGARQGEARRGEVRRGARLFTTAGRKYLALHRRLFFLFFFFSRLCFRLKVPVTAGGYQCQTDTRDTWYEGEEGVKIRTKKKKERKKGKKKKRRDELSGDEKQSVKSSAYRVRLHADYAGYELIRATGYNTEQLSQGIKKCN